MRREIEREGGEREGGRGERERERERTIVSFGRLSLSTFQG